MRLAQFRRKLPCYQVNEEPTSAGIALTGPFNTPEDWSPTAFEGSQKPPHTTNPVIVEEQAGASPKDYFDWIKHIPLAETAAYMPLSYMLPDTVASSTQFEADTVPP